MPGKPKPHCVVIESQEGKSEKHRMKQWLRDHPESVPGVDPFDRKNNAWKLRAALVKQGWNLDEHSDQMLHDL